jgi:hypothetical protein
MNILRRLVLAVALTHLAPALAEAPKQATASAELQKDFAAFIATFRAALKANDAAAVTGMTRLPFDTGDYPDATQFRTKGYPKIFTPKNRACIQRTKAGYERDQLGNDNYSISCGELFFVFTKTQAGVLFTYVSDND